jgi:hypothetical protein
VELGAGGTVGLEVFSVMFGRVGIVVRTRIDGSGWLQAVSPTARKIKRQMAFCIEIISAWRILL